jgi:hypothetical protein
MLEYVIIQRALPSLIRDCKANGCQIEVIKPGRFLIEDTAKSRLAIRLVRERWGLQSIKQQNQ